MRRAAFVYDDRLSRHVYREDHVMRPTRLRYTYELIQAYGLFAQSTLTPPRFATEEELLEFHTRDYVSAVKALSKGEAVPNPERFNFSQDGDNPPFRDMYEAGALSTGASLVAAEMVARGDVDVAFNVSGGLHHAMSGHASGFCVFNDPVIAIEHLVGRGLRPAYIDIDCHHGDGVQAAFYARNDVLTISLHESGGYLFPGTGEVEELGAGPGRGYSVNLPLAPYTGDDVYMWAFMQVVPPLMEAFRPDVLVTQLGMDTHFSDPITHLRLTVEGHGAVVERLGDMAPKWVALGGGGYDMSAVARGWALDYGIMMGVDLPDEIPQAYAQRFGLERLRDGAAPAVDDGVQRRVRQFAEEMVRKVQRLIFPLHRIKV